jgi:hypothetical protein
MLGALVWYVMADGYVSKSGFTIQISSFSQLDAFFELEYLFAAFWFLAHPLKIQDQTGLFAPGKLKPRLS